MRAQFQDLVITGLIGERCYAIEGSILRIHLRLSQAPPLGWSYLFTQIWQTIEYPGKRPAGIEDNALWIECTPEDVRTCHLPQLENALARTNARYRTQHQQKEIAAEHQRELSRMTHLKLDELARSFGPAAAPVESARRHSQPALGKILAFFRRLFAAPAKNNQDERNATRLTYWKANNFATRIE